MTDHRFHEQARHDLAMVRRYLDGEEAVITTLAERLDCVPRILSAQNRRRGQPLDANDLADLSQDTVLVILRKLGQFEGLAPFEGWIYRVCCFEFRNGLRRKVRSRARHAELELETLDGSVAADEAHEQRDEQAALLTALERLGGSEAELIRLKYFEGLTFADIAAALDMPINTAKTRFYRGMQRLRGLVSTGEGRQG